MTALQERFAIINGRRMRYLIGGSGKPLVLCHGFISSGEEFGGRFAELTAQRTIIAPDLPGNGQSEALAVRHTSEAMGGAVQELLDHLNVERFDLGGLCLGGSVACAMVRANGDAVDRLILHTPLLNRHLMRRAYRAQVRGFTAQPVYSGIIWLSRRRLVSDLYKRIAIEGGDVDRETSDINFRNQRAADPGAARDWLRDGIRREDVDVIARRTRPTLIIVPAHDRLVDVAHLRAVVRRLGNVDLFVDDHGGHGWSPEAVQRHLEVIRAALDRDVAGTDSVHNGARVR